MDRGPNPRPPPAAYAADDLPQAGVDSLAALAIAEELRARLRLPLSITLLYEALSAREGGGVADGEESALDVASGNRHTDVDVDDGGATYNGGASRGRAVDTTRGTRWLHGTIVLPRLLETT